MSATILKISLKMESHEAAEERRAQQGGQPLYESCGCGRIEGKVGDEGCSCPSLE